jgi:hypothetical protein
MIPNWRNSLLPDEPRILRSSVQDALTQRFLSPFLTELEACLLTVRNQIDIELSHYQPKKLGKPYPLGQCLEITQAVQKRLRIIEEKSLFSNEMKGLRALRLFQREGGVVRRVWGDLRGQYFQNAFQVGTLYIDVANDTVTPTKPKIEILPFTQAELIPIRDFSHFSAIAERYWQHQTYPNHIFPDLAPHCPLIHVSKDGLFHLHEATGYMLSLTRTGGFKLSEAMLREATMPQKIFEQLCSVLKESGLNLPRTREQGKKFALQQCNQQRAKRWHQDSKRLDKLLRDVHRVNFYMARSLQHSHLQDVKTQKINMPTIKINNKDYDIDKLSIEVKTQLTNIQICDQEIKQFKTQLAVAQTARMTYARALGEALPK